MNNKDQIIQKYNESAQSFSKLGVGLRLVLDEHILEDISILWKILFKELEELKVLISSRDQIIEVQPKILQKKK